MRIPFYFDYACPWAYFGSCRAEAYFADLGVEIEFIPVHLKTLQEPSPNAGELPKMGPRKRTSYLNDLFHWAKLSGVEIAPKAGELRGTDARPALRAAMAAHELRRFGEFHHAAYRARWSEGRDLSRRDVLGELLAAAGLDADGALARAESPDVDQQLTRRTQEAIDRGVFGVPTLFVGDEMFWGNDRFELVRHFVQEASLRRTE